MRWDAFQHAQTQILCKMGPSTGKHARHRVSSDLLQCMAVLPGTPVPHICMRRVGVLRVVDWNSCGADSCKTSCRNDEKKPRRIAALRGIEITQVSTGGWHCLALDSAGLVYAWGGNEYGQCHVEWAVRCANAHALAHVSIMR